MSIYINPNGVFDAANQIERLYQEYQSAIQDVVSKTKSQVQAVTSQNAISSGVEKIEKINTNLNTYNPGVYARIGIMREAAQEYQNAESQLISLASNLPVGW